MCAISLYPGGEGIEMCLVLSVVQRFQNWLHGTPGVDNAQKLRSGSCAFSYRYKHQIRYNHGWYLWNLTRKEDLNWSNWFLYLYTYNILQCSQLDVKDASHCNKRPDIWGASKNHRNNSRASGSANSPCTSCQDRLKHRKREIRLRWHFWEKVERECSRYV